MASTFFSNDDAERATPTETTAAQTKPALTSIKCKPIHADTATHHEGSRLGHGLRRQEVSPPSLFTRSSPRWKAWITGFWCWLLDMDEPHGKPAPATGLRKVKSEFNSAMWDLQSLKANQVRALVEQARSLRELWHLRADVFRVISVHRGQIEAQLRLDTLDGHFPVRSSSSGDESRSSRATTW